MTPPLASTATAPSGPRRARALDVDRLRAETPGCREVVHFNHAGASLMPQPVLDAVLGHLDREARTGGYEAEAEAVDRLAAAYASLAALLNAAPDEIAVVENATRAWDMACYALPLAAGDRVLTSVSEYGSNVLALLQIAQRGVRVETVPNDDDGQISVAALEAMLDDRVKLIALSHMPTNGGLVQPAAAVGRLARAAGVPFLLDATQTVGQLPIDVAAIGCDLLAATSRKYLRGPRGVGFLFVRRPLIGRLEPPFLDIHAAEWTGPASFTIRPDARRFENWESNVAAKLGLGAAVDYALALGLDPIWDRVRGRADRLRRRLGELPGVVVHDLGAVKGGIVAFAVAGVAPAAVQTALRAQRINVSVSGRASTRWDMEARGLDALVRASVHYLTTDDEIDRLVAALAALPR